MTKRCRNFSKILLKIPWRRSAAVAAAMGVAAPDLMADEKQKPAKKNIVPPVKK
jgi:hypothetical protein